MEDFQYKHFPDFVGIIQIESPDVTPTQASINQLALLSLPPSPETPKESDCQFQNLASYDYIDRKTPEASTHHTSEQFYQNAYTQYYESFESFSNSFLPENSNHCVPLKSVVKK